MIITLRAKLQAHLLIKHLIDLIRQPPRMHDIPHIDLRRARVRDNRIRPLKRVQLSRRLPSQG
jgi:hypothetical protein